MTSTPEQRLFTRILRLTLLQGIVIGIWGIFTGIWVYNFPFFFEGPFGSLPMILFGVMMVLQVEITRLRSQFLALPQKGNGDCFSKHFFRLVGFFFTVLGVVLLISKPLNFPNPRIPETQQIGFTLFLGLTFLCIFLIIGAISWYLSLRDKRHITQKE